LIRASSAWSERVEPIGLVKGVCAGVRDLQSVSVGFGLLVSLSRLLGWLAGPTATVMNSMCVYIYIYTHTRGVAAGVT
jgi:hypothetical protein